jgi:hypothetical protein
VNDDSPLFQMLRDHRSMEAKFGPLDLREFVVLWNEAHAFTDEAMIEGFRPEEVPSLYSWLKTDESRSDRSMRGPLLD